MDALHFSTQKHSLRTKNIHIFLKRKQRYELIIYRSLLSSNWFSSRGFSNAAFNASSPDKSLAAMITRVQNSENSFYKLLDLFLKLRQETQLANSIGTNITKYWLKDKVKSIKKTIDENPYIGAYGISSLDNFEKIENDLNVRIIIWTKRTRRDHLKVSYEGIKTGGRTIDINYFSDIFEPFSNPNLNNLALVLDLEAFTKKHKYNASFNEVKIRSCTFFQALTHELKPNLVGPAFDRQTEEYRQKWGKTEFHVADAKKFYKLFSIGIQLWSVVRGNKKKVTRKLFDTYWKKKIILGIGDHDINEAICVDQLVTYIPDFSEIYFFSCYRKYCFFGKFIYKSNPNRTKKFEKKKLVRLGLAGVIRFWCD